MIDIYQKLNYNYTSHCFDPIVILCYNNLIKYNYKITDKYLLINQQKRDTFFLFDKDYQPKSERKSVIYCEEYFEKATKVKEVEYYLDDVFLNKTKSIRRGIFLTDRKEIRIEDFPINQLDKVYLIYNDWKNYKENDGKTFRITFSPTRYLRSWGLGSKVEMYKKIIYVKEKVYGVINFHLNKDRAYEISFISRFFDKDLKIINDLNECIIINCFYDLWKNHKIKIINTGQEAGIKGLRIFKEKIPYKYNIIYKK
jgi:hypothetical protein